MTPPTYSPQVTIITVLRTADPQRSAALEQEGFSVISSEGGEQRRAGLVVFCAPPTGNPDYAQVGRPGAKYSNPNQIILL